LSICTVTVIELSDEQKEHILNSGEFSKFFDKATRLMERALCETVDITFDYSGAETEDMEGYVYYFTTWTPHFLNSARPWAGLGFQEKTVVQAGL